MAATIYVVDSDMTATVLMKNTVKLTKTVTIKTFVSTDFRTKQTTTNNIRVVASNQIDATTSR